jgi:hypothetical protein
LSSDSVKTIKEKIQDKEGISPVSQTLTHEGRILEDEKILADYNIKN